MRQVTVYVMIGLPGSGKNTWINANLGRKVRQLSRDDIRENLCYCKAGEKIVGSKEQEANVSKIFNNLLVEYVSSGYDVVINNINLRKKYRDDYKKLLSRYNVKWVYVVIEAPSIEDNISRRQGQVPEDVLRNMYNGFVMPSPDEYDEIIHYKQTK